MRCHQNLSVEDWSYVHLNTLACLDALAKCCLSIYLGSNSFYFNEGKGVLTTTVFSLPIPRRTFSDASGYNQPSNFSFHIKSRSLLSSFLPPSLAFGRIEVRNLPACLFAVNPINRWKKEHRFNWHSQSFLGGISKCKLCK